MSQFGEEDDPDAILEKLRDAAEEYDSEKLEDLLRKAEKKDLDKNDLMSSRLIFQQLQSEAFVLEALDEAMREGDLPEPPIKSLKRLQNLSAQVRRLGGDVVKTKSARKSVAFAAVSADTAGQEEIGATFNDLSEFAGLKPVKAWRGHRRTVFSVGSESPAPERKSLKLDVTMLCHSKVTIAEALTQVPKECEELAVQNFRDVLMWMGDRPAQEAQRQAARDAIISLVRTNNELRDEIYIQTLKQLNKNPSARSELKGWQLMHFLCLSIAPSDEAILYVKAFLDGAANAEASDAASQEEKKLIPARREWAVKCITALDAFDTLKRMSGYLWKKSPKTLRFGASDWRYFKVRNMQLFWWKSLEDADEADSARPDGGSKCKGYINLLANECEVVKDERNKTGFTVRALGGNWAKDALFKFKGRTRAKRVFTFDTSGSEHRREEWLDALTAHLDRAAALRNQKGENVRWSVCSMAPGDLGAVMENDEEKDVPTGEDTEEAETRWEGAPNLSDPKPGDQVYYKCQSNALPDGSELKYGDSGSLVKVSAEVADCEAHQRVTVKFPNIKYNISCACSELSREQPPSTLAGGWQVLHPTWYKSELNELEDGSQIWYGTKGEVCGPSTLGDGEDYRRVAVRFPGISNPVSIFVDELSWDEPPVNLSGGWKVGAEAWYKGQYNGFDDGSKLVYGLVGKIVGPDKEDNSRLTVKFEGIEFYVACNLADLSQERPKETRLPVGGNWHIGDKAFYKGPRVAIPGSGGQELSPGNEVEIGGRSTEDDDGDGAKKVAVRRPGGTELLNVAISSLSSK